jgi:hypothetical protein
MQFTTLVPAYKPKYLVELLTALRHQTVKPAKVVFSDDSPNQSFVAMLSAEPIRSAVADLHIEVVPGPRNGGYNNFRHLLKRYRQQATCRTGLFHLQLDDDIPYPSFYERHLQAHRSANVQCVVSRRWTALESGQPLRDLPVPPAISAHPQRLLALDAKLLFAHTAGNSTNWLGEFSNATFRADMAEGLEDPSFVGIPFDGLEDLGAFLKASLSGPIGYINDHLGYFRTSADHNSANPMGRPLKLAHLAYITLAMAGRHMGQLTTEQCDAVLERMAPIVQFRYGREADLAEICALMPRLAQGESSAQAEFLVLWDVYSGAAARRSEGTAPGADVVRQP